MENVAKRTKESETERAQLKAKMAILEKLAKFIAVMALVMMVAVLVLSFLS